MGILLSAQMEVGRHGRTRVFVTVTAPRIGATCQISRLSTRMMSAMITRFDWTHMRTAQPMR
jgi:hypothetical protein